MKKTKKRKIPGLLEVSKLKKKADKVFSRWIRNRDKHICYTCGKVMQPNESQNGHYISRSYYYLRYDERNCHCQCVACNVFNNGNIPLYSVKLESQYGFGILQDLEKDKRLQIGKARDFLNKIIEKYDTQRVA